MPRCVEPITGNRVKVIKSTSHGEGEAGMEEGGKKGGGKKKSNGREVLKREGERPQRLGNEDEKSKHHYFV